MYSASQARTSQAPNAKGGAKGSSPGPFMRKPSLGPIKASRASILREPKFILDGVSKDYVVHWTPQMAVDEHVQNWRDQMEIVGKGRDITLWKSPRHDGTTFFTSGTRLLAVLVVRKSSDAFGHTVVVTLRNYSARLFPWHFQFGASGKRDLQNCRGKFGDGLPSSTLVLTRYTTADLDEEKRKVIVASCGREYSFGFERGAMAQESSCFTIYNHPYEPSSYSRTIDGAFTFDPFQDTEVTLHLRCGDFDPSRYLFLHEIPEDKLLTSSHGQVILDPKYKKTIYLRGMQVQKDGHFGYNFEKVSSQSRDRQNTIPDEELQRNVVDLWLTLVHIPKAAHALYDSLLKNSDSLESRAFQDAEVNTSVASNRLATVFQQRNHGGFPLVQGDSEGKHIVEQLLKRKAVFVTRTLFALLSGAEKLEVSVSAAWEAFIQKFIRTANVIPKDALSQRLCDDVASVIQPLVEKPVSMLMVSGKIPRGSICVVDGPKTNCFKLTGFQRYELNGIYKEMSGKSIHGREAFRGGSNNDYCMVWNSSLSQWNLVHYTDLPMWSRQSTTWSYAGCSLGNFWNQHNDSKWCPWVEWTKEEYLPAKRVTVSPGEAATKTGLSQYRVFVSRQAVMKQCHDLTSRANRNRCESREIFENTCFCAHDSLVEVISDYFQQQCRVYVPKKASKKQRAMLHSICASSREEWKRLCGGATEVNYPASPTQISSSLAKWLAGLRDGSTSLADYTSDPFANQMKDLLNNGLLRAGRPVQADAYLGDAFLDLYVAWEGTVNSLSANEMDNLRRAILSNANMGGRKRATLFEAKVGGQVQKWPKTTWCDLAGPISALAMPESTETLRKRVERHITETSRTSSHARPKRRQRYLRRNSLLRGQKKWQRGKRRIYLSVLLARWFEKSSPLFTLSLKNNGSHPQKETACGNRLLLGPKCLGFHRQLLRVVELLGGPKIPEHPAGERRGRMAFLWANA